MKVFDLLVRNSARLGLWLALLATLFTGCHSTVPGSASFASVTIANRLPEEIRRVTEEVFRGNGYHGYSGVTGEMVFEKEGSRMNQLAYGGWLETHQGNTTWVRVRLTLVDLGDGSHRLQCQAFMVPHHGDSFFEEEQRLTNIRSAPYQQLLNEIAARLK